MRKNLIYAVCLAGLVLRGFFYPVQADIVQNLYEIEMPVEGQGQEERSFAAREALKEILVRISGKSIAAEIAADEALVPRPTRLVQQFRYRNFDSDEIIPAAPDGAKPYTQKLWLKFTESAVAKLLLNQLLPVWGKSRPATLIWLVVDDQKQRVLVGNNTTHLARTFVEQQAVKRGLPVRLPLLDLADQAKVQVTDVWANFEDIILEASKRYQTEAILVGRIYLSIAKSWHTRWSLYLNGQRHNWEESDSASLEQAVMTGISQTGEILSSTFAQVQDTDASNNVLLKVTGITDLKTYNRVMNYLDGLNIVKDVYPYQVMSSEVIFNVKSHSGRLGLAQAISLGRVLVAETTSNMIVNNPANRPTQNTMPGYETSGRITSEITLPGDSENKKKPEIIQPDLVYKLVL